MIRSALRRHHMIRRIPDRFIARHSAGAADRAEIWAILAERRMDPAFAWQVAGEVRHRHGVRCAPTELPPVDSVCRSLVVGPAVVRPVIVDQPLGVLTTDG